ncbi:MAG: ABC transporter substrate-binding protein, partial [Planctomycetes bacterium]|nr:ABC transporter substrate-binding protein [Planctomycetota bacterium]
IVDGSPKDVAKFLPAWTARGIPTVLTPRSFGPEVRALDASTLVVLGQSPATRHTTSSFRADFEAAYGPLRYGAAEGFESANLVLRAIDAADSRDRKAILRAIDGITAEGARGRVTYSADTEAAEPPLGVWQFEGKTLSPYFPPTLSVQAAEAGTKVEREPDPNLGEPFRTWRARDFEFEPGTQWVWCTWGPEGKRTIDHDLAELGLSTKGEHPIVDRIVRDEIMARVIAITSMKFGRNADGSPIPGKSLNISFAMYKPKDVKKRRIWPAIFAGDDSAAGGRAFGTYCEIYTTFIRRTIFQPHALTPSIGPEDLCYLDGSYEFGSDHVRDKRSELIRALINGYGGSMALTTSHEVGHLLGLGHITDDPHGIMNVEEGAGIDYRDAHFTPGSWEIMRAAIGLSGDEPGGKRKKSR